MARPRPVATALGLRPGESVVVDSPGHSYKAVIDETMPSFNLVWVREFGTGERRLIHLGESTIHRGAEAT
jgi:hypothetical protein